MAELTVVDYDRWVTSVDPDTGASAFVSWWTLATESEKHRPDPGTDLVEISRLLTTVYGVARAVVLVTPGRTPKERFAELNGPRGGEIIAAASAEYLNARRAAGDFAADVFMQTPDLVCKETQADPTARMRVLNPKYGKFGRDVTPMLPVEFAATLPFLQMNPVGRMSKGNSAASESAGTSATYSVLSQRAPGSTDTVKKWYTAPSVLILGDTMLDVIRANLTVEALVDDDLPSWEDRPGLARAEITGPVSYHTRMTTRIKAVVEDGLIHTYDIAWGDGYADPAYDIATMHPSVPGSAFKQGAAFSDAVGMLLPEAETISGVTDMVRLRSGMASMLVYAPVRDSNSTIWTSVQVTRLNIPADTLVKGSVHEAFGSAAYSCVGSALSAVWVFTRSLLVGCSAAPAVAKNTAAAAKERALPVMEELLAKAIGDLQQITTYEEADLRLGRFSGDVQSAAKAEFHRQELPVGIRALTRNGGRTPSDTARRAADRELAKMPTKVIRPAIHVDADYG